MKMHMLIVTTQNPSMLPWWQGQIIQSISAVADAPGGGMTLEILKQAHCGLHLKRMGGDRSLGQSF